MTYYSCSEFTLKRSFSCKHLVSHEKLVFHTRSEFPLKSPFCSINDNNDNDLYLARITQSNTIFDFCYGLQI